MADFQPPPTYADPVIVDPITGKSAFNPIWLKWFVDISSGLGPGGAGSGTVNSVAETFTGGLISVGGSPITSSGTLALTVAGTSGGVPYFSSASTWASSALLTQNALVLGGGAAGAPAPLASLGTTSTVLHGNAAGAPTFGAVALATDVSGTLGVGNGGTGVTSSTGNTNLVLSNSPTLVTPTLGAASATSINFGQTSLSYYEEGTWTPSVGGTATYSARNAQYVKIGKFVYCNGYLQINSLGTGSTTLISGLPFTVANVTAYHNGSIAYYATSATNIVSMTIQANANATTASLYSATAAAASSAGNNIFQNGTSLYFGLIYQATT